GGGTTLKIVMAAHGGVSRARLEPRRWSDLGGLSSLSLWSASLLATTLVSYTAARGDVRLGVVVLALAVLGTLLSVPTRVLPIGAAAVVLVVPTESIPVPHLLHAAPLALVPFGIWLARLPDRRPLGAVPAILAVMLVAWLLASALAAPFHTRLG